MPRLYLIRHGQTEHNANDIIQGQIDSPLTSLGQQQVKKTAEALRDISFTACYHSPLGRTTSTAREILKYHHVPVYPRDGLMEINMGSLEGEVNDHRIHGEEFENFSIYPHKYNVPVPEGETYESLTNRVYSCIREIAGKYQPEDNILIVTHGGPLRSLLNPLINKPLSGFWFEPDITPASISIVRWEKGGKPELISFAGTDKDKITYDPDKPHGMIRPN